MDLALGLESFSPDAGSVGGPDARESRELADEIQILLMHVYGDGATITVGSDANVAVGHKAKAIRIEPGDIPGLLGAAEEYLSQDGAAELESALVADGNSAGKETRSFLDRLRAGAVGLAAGVATNGAYDGIVTLLSQAFPATSG